MIKQTRRNFLGSLFGIAFSASILKTVPKIKNNNLIPPGGEPWTGFSDGWVKQYSYHTCDQEYNLTFVRPSEKIMRLNVGDVIEAKIGKEKIKMAIIEISDHISYHEYFSRDIICRKIKKIWRKNV